MKRACRQGAIAPGGIFGGISIMAITAQFIPSDNTLFIAGDTINSSEAISISLNATGLFLVNGGAVAVTGGTPTTANTSLIIANGQTGNDTITMGETGGALVTAIFWGESGNDVLTGGSAGDALYGQGDHDTLLG